MRRHRLPFALALAPTLDDAAASHAPAVAPLRPAVAVACGVALAIASALAFALGVYHATRPPRTAACEARALAATYAGQPRIAAAHRATGHCAATARRITTD